jgi:hypothetical protein
MPSPAQYAADQSWRINRIGSIEDSMLGLGHYETVFRTSQSFVNLSIYQQRLRQLRELQTERHVRHKAAMDDVIRLLKTQQMKGLPREPEVISDKIGFVLASAEMTAEKAPFNLAIYTSTAGDLVTGARNPSQRQ